MRHDDMRHDTHDDGLRDDEFRDGALRDDELRDGELRDGEFRDDEIRRDPDVPEQGAPVGATPPAGSPFGTPGPATTDPVTDPATDPVSADDGRHHEPELGVEDPDRREFGVVESEPEVLVEPEPVDEPAAEATPVDEPAPEATPVAAAPAPGATGKDAGAALFGTEDVARFRLQWRELQADFVDDPKDAVQGADRLVGELMTALSEIVAEHKRVLEESWHSGAGETEDLRVALRKYRSFFDQLLKT